VRFDAAPNANWWELEGEARAAELDRLLEEELAEAEKARPTLPKDRPLDEVFASRTHVRVLRVLVTLDRHINLSGRDTARRAEVSHGRALTVLRHLASIGAVTSTVGPHATIYRLADHGPLAPALRALFLWEREEPVD